METFKRKIRELLYDILPHELLARAYFKMSLGYSLNLDAPKTFNEKINWYKLFYCPEKELVVKCSDKFRMREYLTSKGLETYLVPLIGVWNDAESISFDELPEKFVLKTNHGCHFNAICTDKSMLDIKGLKKQLNKWMKIKYGKLNVEPHYNKIKPLIICEKYLGDGENRISDFKLHCFNGRPQYFEVCSDRVINGDAESNAYDVSWNHLDFFNCIRHDTAKPECLYEMIDIAKRIAEDFPYVRVDFYVYNDKPLIGELTFVPAGGMDWEMKRETDINLGEKLDLSGL